MNKAHTRVIKLLKELEDNWPDDLWIFVAGGDLCLMEKVDGERATRPDGGMAMYCVVDNFPGIEADGGDW